MNNLAFIEVRRLKDVERDNSDIHLRLSDHKQEIFLDFTYTQFTQFIETVHELFIDLKDPDIYVSHSDIEVISSDAGNDNQSSS